MASKIMEEELNQDNFSDDSDEGSDEELQSAFLTGKVKPGLNRVVEKVEKIFVNKVAELNEKYKEIKLELDWLERLDVTCDVKKEDGDSKIEKTTDIQDDFKREMKFYKQAQMAFAEALPKLRNLGIPIERPSDYFAEMVKTDDHMQKVREKLITKELAMEKSEKARKLRAMKKYGKKVQQEVMQKRQQEKKQMLESVKKYRKGQKGKPEFLKEDDDEFEINTEKGTKRPAPNKAKGKSAKRQRKDSRYGFGGKKRGMKQNTAESVADTSTFSSAKHSKPPRAKAKTKAKRLGKSRRQKMKTKGR